MVLFFFFLLGLIWPEVISLSVRSPQCVHFRNCHSHDFVIKDTPNSDTPLTLKFAIKHQNVDKLSQALNEVSNPKSPNYGKYWTGEEVGRLTTHNQAREILFSHILKFVAESQVSFSPLASTVEIKTDIKTAEKILGAKYFKFHSPTTNAEILRTLEYELPKEVSETIDYVSPTVHFPPTKHGLLGRNGIERQALGSITPAILSKYYNFTSNTVTDLRATQSVVFLEDMNFAPKDLKTFQKTASLPTDAVDRVIGKNVPKNCTLSITNCAEGNLDVQYILATARKSPTTVWKLTDSGGIFEWILNVSAQPNPPLVHSMSFGGPESIWDFAEQQRFSEEATKLGLRGVTLVAASGDDGAPNMQEVPAQCGLEVNFPANVPYVLTVGGTAGAERGLTETAAQSDVSSAITSGGGFSGLFNRPDYQNVSVEQYLSNPNVTSFRYFPPVSQFSSRGRAYPDVSIAANYYWYIINGAQYYTSGTSASAPVFAGIISLANNARFKLRKSPVGFVNPALYQLSQEDPSIFHDITSGDNHCASKSSSPSGPVCCQYGYVCSRGWDPVTGLGSVNVGRLIQALASLP